MDYHFPQYLFLKRLLPFLYVFYTSMNFLKNLYLTVTQLKMFLIIVKAITVLDFGSSVYFKFSITLKKENEF